MAFATVPAALDIVVKHRAGALCAQQDSAATPWSPRNPRRGDRGVCLVRCAVDEPTGPAAAAAVSPEQVASLREAIISSSLSTVKTLLVSGGSALVNEGYVPAGDAASLHLTAFRGDQPILEALLAEDGVNVDVKNNRGNSPLQMAAIAGHVRVAAMLIIAGADGGHTSDDNATALDYALEWGQEEVAALLMKEKVARTAGGNIGGSIA